MAGHSPPADLSAAHRQELMLYAGCAVTFTGAAAITWYSCRMMAGGMEMPGGWTMSMAWMPMGSRLQSALTFAGMWVAMMVAMMLPSTLPMLRLYRKAAVFRGEVRVGLLSTIVAAGYFGVWTVFGMLAYIAGLAISFAAMKSGTFSRAVPIATGAALIAAGVYQLSPWKSACLKHCRDPLSVVAAHLEGGWRGALRLGIHHGAFCTACCWALMLIQLALGIMEILVMIVVALVIALEKLFPRGLVVARVTGVLAVGGGFVLVARALVK